MHRSIRVAVVATLFAPMLSAAPAVLAAPPDPEAVPPSLQEIALPALPVTGPTKTSAPSSVTTQEMDTAPFSVVGVTWKDDPAVGAVGVEVRTREDGAWTGWADLDGEDDASPDEGSVEEVRQRAGTAPYWVGEADGVQVRVTSSGVAPTDLQLSLVDPGTSDADDEVATSSGSTASAALSRPAIKTRAQWGADESIRRGSPSYASTIQAATLHHTASSNSYSQSDVPAIMRGFYAYHVRSRGWSDIGYNFLVDKYGTMWEGRAGGMDRPVVGAHAGGFNTDTVGVSMIGTFDAVAPSSAQLHGAAQIIAWKLSLYGRDPKGSVTMTSGGSTRYSAGTRVTLPRIFGHRQVSQTTCPGAKGYAAMPGLRDDVAAKMAGDTGGPANSAPTGTLDEVTPREDGTVRLRGWALDPDTDDPIEVVVQVDGEEAARFTADDSRPDVDAAYGRGDKHGFDVRVPASPGRHQVCVWAKDSATGAGVSIGGCPSVTVPEQTSSGPSPSPSPTPAPTPTPTPTPTPQANLVPQGSLDEVVPMKDDVAGPVELVGWAMDPDTDDPVVVALDVDGEEVRRVVADQPRPDLSRFERGENHGWRAKVELAEGEHEICVRALDAATGEPEDIACRSVVLTENVAPVGFLDLAAPWRNSTVKVLGWAMDANADRPVEVTVTVDGKEVETLVADSARPDLVRAGQTPEERRGFELVLPAERGTHEVCLLVSDTSTAEQVEIRCADVVVGPHRRTRAA